MVNENFDHTIKSILDYFEKHIALEGQLEELVLMILENIHNNIDKNAEGTHSGLIAECYKTILRDVFPIGEERFQKLANKTYMASKCFKKPILSTPAPGEIEIFNARKRYLEQIKLTGMGNMKLAEDIMGNFVGQ